MERYWKCGGRVTKAFNSLMKCLSSGSAQHFCSHLGPALCFTYRLSPTSLALVSSLDMPESAFKLWKMKDVTNVLLSAYFRRQSFLSLFRDNQKETCLMLPELMKFSANQTVRNTCVQLDGMRSIPCDCASQPPSQAHREKNVTFLK